MEEEQEFFLGNIEFVIHEMPNHRQFSERERKEIALDVVAQVVEQLDEVIPGIRFKLIVNGTRSGCIRVNASIIMIMAAVGTATYWPLVKPAIQKVFSHPTQEISCVVNGQRQQCKVVAPPDKFNLPGLTTRYQIQDGDTLEKIISQTWHRSPQEIPQISKRILQRYPKAFVNQDIHQLRTGAWIALPPPPEKAKGSS